MRKASWIIGILAITASLVMAGNYPCFAINTQDTGYQVTTADQTIDVFGTCKQVRSSRSLFAPTKTSGEWNNFLNWGNSILTLSACATCSDGIQNQGETGIDCGGPCPACASCSDGIKNQGETGIDCGGPCPACGGTPTCSDGIQNQGETGIDCGGPCPACGCGSNYTQMADGSCCGPYPDYRVVSGACISSCGVALGQAGLPDAGWGCCSTGCAPDHANAGAAYDCVYCCANTGDGACADSATCSDGIQNQGETGIDCGGPCAACPSGPECAQNSDCSNKGACYICNGGVCENTVVDCYKCADGVTGYGRISQTFCGSCQNGFVDRPVDGCPCANDNYFCGGAPCQWNYDQQACVQPP